MCACVVAHTYHTEALLLKKSFAFVLLRFYSHAFVGTNQVPRVNAGGCTGCKPCAFSPSSSPDGCSRWAGIPRNRRARCADRLLLSVSKHVGDCTCAGRRPPSVPLGVPSSLLPALGWLPLGVRRPPILPGGVLPDVG